MSVKCESLLRAMVATHTDREFDRMLCVTRGTSSQRNFLRSYKTQHRTQENYDCAIWEAASATAAAPFFFKKVKLLTSGEEFWDGGLRRNNPVNEAVTEVAREGEKAWSGRTLGCLVSIGTGCVDSAKVSSSLSGLAKSVLKMLSDSEDTARAFRESQTGQLLASEDRYYRFNVPQGLQSLDMDECRATEKMKDFTTAYMDHPEIGNQVEKCARLLFDPDRSS